MEQRTFDELVRHMIGGATRRKAMGLAAAIGLGGLAWSRDDAEAKKKKRKKKLFCLNGKQVKAKHKKKKRRLRRQGATRGKCPDTCTPVCPSGACGVSNGCGGTCGCSGDTVCAAGTCMPCTITCTSDAATCGTALKAHLTATTTGSVYICPGLYSSTTGFVQQPGVNIYGAGSGSNQASNTILDALNSGPSTTLQASTVSDPATIAGLRITGGFSTDVGGLAVLANDGRMTIDSCAIVGNTGSNVGGLRVIGNADLTNVTMSGNTGTNMAGGLFFIAATGQHSATITNSVFDDNTGGQFGGVSISGIVPGATVTVDTATQITNNTFTVLAGDRAGGIGQATGSVVAVNVTGVTISGNSTPQCLNVTGCSL
ncbi:MAG: hypothetical protein QM692_17045 [Thermomicrobiales bacterium]